MSVVIELDEKLIEEIDKAADNLKKDRLQYSNESLAESLQDDFLQKKKTDADKSQKIY